MNKDERWGPVRGRVEVLLLEDNLGDARLLEAEFHGETLLDVHLTVAPRLAEGLQRLAEREFDAVLLDLNLPDSQGIETLERLRDAAPELPLIVYTGLQDDEVAVRALRSGAQDYIVKAPGIGPLLIRAVNFAIERHRVRVELDLRAEHLDRNRATMRRIVEASADIILILSHTGALRFVHRGDAAMYTCAAADLVGRVFVRKAGTQEVDIPGPDGELRTAEVRTVEIDWDGEPATMVTLHDVTERKRVQLSTEAEKARLEERVKERTAELVRANSDLEAFAYSVSHDLRAPLRHIKGFTQMLEEESTALDEGGRALVGRILKAVERMQALIESLLSFSRLGRCPVTRQKVNPRPIVEDVIEELAPECEGREVEWKIGELPEVDADPALLRVVFVNLISNGLKFTRGRKPACIEVLALDGFVAPVLAVRDNGAGFPASAASRLFGVFQRLHTDAEFEGTGVGLATVKRIVTRHGGRIWAEGEQDRGAAFYFTLGGAKE